MVKDINCLIEGRNLFELIFISFKDILFELNKFYFSHTNHFFKSKKVAQTNHFLRYNQIFFLSVYIQITKFVFNLK